MSKEYKILSLDGGGIRGICEIILLNIIEKRLNKPIYSVFDMIAGTSAGGIITLLLSSGYTTEEVINFFLGQECKSIFKKRLPLIHPYKYASKDVNEVFLNKFKDKTTKDCKTEILIPIYDTETRKATFLTKEDDFLLRDIVRGTSAAPTYFEPHNFSGITAIDGGIFANNPAMCAYVEAKKKGYEDILVLSIGSGTLTKPMPYNKIKNFNTLQWITPLIDCIFDGINDTIEHQLKYIMPENKYFRLQVKLNEENLQMDDVSDKNLYQLVSIVKKYIDNDWLTEINLICSYLDT